MTKKNAVLPVVLSCRTLKKLVERVFVDSVERNRLKKNKPNGKDTQKLNLLRSLYFIVYNDDRDLHPLSIELFHILGEILEGVSPNDLSLRQINRETLLRELSTYD